jgi:tRNA (guanine37-N1)-methyltransferase
MFLRFLYNNSLGKLEEKIAVKVVKSKAEEVRRKLKLLGLIDNDFKPKVEEDYVFFPLKTTNGLDVLTKDYSLEIASAFFKRRSEKARSLREALVNILPEKLHQYIPSSIDFVGDVALIRIPEELESYSKEIGRVVMEIYPRVKTVLSKRGETIGEYRIRMFNVIAGRLDTETIHREHGCIYKLDIMRTFFNPRMSGERLRVAQLVKDNEDVLDMFAGIGPFSILIAKKNSTVKVTAIELNPDAYRYLLTNISLNKVEDRVRAIHGDVRQVLRGIETVYDRIIMDLPFDSLKFLGLALSKLKNNGIIHLYHVESGEDPISRASTRVAKLAEELGYKVELIYSRRVLEVAPLKFIITLDLMKTK